MKYINLEEIEYIILMKRLIKITVTLIALYFAISLFLASLIMRPVARHINISPFFIGNTYKDVSFKTSDNLILKGWLFNPSKKTAIMFVPGILDNRTNEGYYGAVLSKELINKGYAVLMFDPRGKGDSQGNIKLKHEERDVVAAFNFLKNIGFSADKIAIIADSSGATSTLLALQKIKGVGVVVLDSTPLHFKEVFDHSLTKEIDIPSLFLPGIHLSLNTFYTFNVQDLSRPDKKNISNNTSFLILHNRYDQSVPVKNSEQLKANLGNIATLAIFPKGSHIETFKFNPQMYRNKVFNFLSEKLK